MTESKRFFFIVQPAGSGLKLLLDGIKAVADPTQKSPSHITVKGPYSTIQRKRLFHESALVAGQTIKVLGAGQFFHENQNTVLFKCACNPVLHALWQTKTNKTYSEFNPHLTLYNGPDRRYAQRLFDVISAHQISFDFMITKMDLYQSQIADEKALRHQLDYPLLNRMANFQINSDTIMSLSEDQRLMIIDRLCQHLSVFARPSRQSP